MGPEVPEAVRKRMQDGGYKTARAALQSHGRAGAEKGAPCLSLVGFLVSPLQPIA